MSQDQDSTQQKYPTQVKIRRNKCFREEFAGFDDIKPINIIIGRNNSGKSVLLDLIEYVVKRYHVHEVKKDNPLASLLDPECQFIFSRVLSETSLKHFFPENRRMRGDNFIGEYWDCHGKYLLSCPIEFQTNQEMETKASVPPEIKPQYGNWNGNEEDYRKRLEDMLGDASLVHFSPPPLANKQIRRLSAERDIVPEEQKNELYLKNNGEGAANVIHTFLHDSIKNRDIIRHNLLDALNTIMFPDKPGGSDEKFLEIVTRYDSEQKWEIYLEEKKKGTIPLSKSGSGLKTVLLVLLNLLVVPKFPKGHENLSDYVFCFEELENNLHPSLLRRLYRYIESFATPDGPTFFITTHSNIVIDFFSRSRNAQIIHVTHDGEKATTKKIHHFTGKNAILDDLGVRASDLLQANGIVWLEGPSDRVYFNKWVEIYSNGTLQEHRDYECAVYGGSNLPHHQATDPNSDGDFINIFRINRNAILLADSDKNHEDATLKKRVADMKTQMEDSRGLIWVFEAREVENYLPGICIQSACDLETPIPDIQKHHLFFHKKKTCYWKKVTGNTTFNKVDFAKKVAPSLTKPLLDTRFDLQEQMENICKMIQSWQDIS